MLAVCAALGGEGKMTLKIWLWLLVAVLVIWLARRLKKSPEDRWKFYFKLVAIILLGAIAVMLGIIVL